MTTVEGSGETDDAIVALRREIERLDAKDDPESRQRLEELVDRLQARLERREQGPVDDAVREFVERYEARYPELTLMINNLAVRLASMGI